MYGPTPSAPSVLDAETSLSEEILDLHSTGNAQRLECDARLIDLTANNSGLDARTTEFTCLIQDLKAQYATLSEGDTLRRDRSKLISERAMLETSTAQHTCALEATVPASARSHAPPVVTAARRVPPPPPSSVLPSLTQVPDSYVATTISPAPMDLQSLSTHLRHLSLYHFALNMRTPTFPGTSLHRYPSSRRTFSTAFSRLHFTLQSRSWMRLTRRSTNPFIMRHLAL